MLRFVVGCAVVAVGLAGCQNSCQALCDTLAERSAACGLDYSEADVDRCRADLADASGEQVGLCLDFGQPATVERQWSCEDVLLYRDLLGTPD